MAVRLSGHVTLTCDTEAEYLEALADVQSAAASLGVYTNVVGDAVAKTVDFDVDQGA